ncbi:hypothetical protein pb186bvf_018447 [Paramecium bursaria]
MNSKDHLKMLMKSYYKKDTINQSMQDSRKQSQHPKMNKIITDLLDKRQSSQDIHKSKNTSQRSISPSKLYQIPDSLSKVYKQIQNKINKQKSPIRQQKTEESRSYKNDSTSSTIYDMDEQIQQIIGQEECISTIIAVAPKKSKVIKLCQNYLNAIPTFNIDHKDKMQQKIICKSILLERIGILVVLFQAMAEEGYDEQLQNIRNLLYYIHNNMITRLELISVNCNSKSQRELIDSRLTKINRKLQKSIPDIGQIRKISNVIYSLLVLFIENSPDLKYNNLEKIISKIDQISFQQGINMIKHQIQQIIGEIQYLRQTRETIETEKTLDQEEFEKCLELKVPYLAPTQKFSLIIDLDETLVHYKEQADEGQFLVRPYAEQFLIEMSKHFEIIIFTAALQDYADFILDLIDKDNVISHRLYRQHTTFHNGTFVKDLTKIGRSLKTSIIIDNLAENFQFQSDNGIFIQSWYGEPDDRALYQLAPILRQIVQKKYKDVRQALRQLRDKMLENIENGIENPHLHLQL